MEANPLTPEKTWVREGFKKDEEEMLKFTFFLSFQTTGALLVSNYSLKYFTVCFTNGKGYKGK